MKLQKIIALLFFMTCATTSSNIHSQNPLLFVEGNIGVGKSTFLQMLSDCFPTIDIITEPVDVWQNINGYNLLQSFYQDSARWSCSFQLYALMTKLRKLESFKESAAPLQVMERSWFADRYCFAQNCLQLNTLQPLEWELYCDIWSWHAQKAPRPIGIIYLQADSEVCYDRMKSRARNEESIVPLDYLRMLHERHEEWLIQGKYKQDECGACSVLVLDGSLNFRDDLAVQQTFVQQILDFLNKHESIDFTI